MAMHTAMMVSSASAEPALARNRCATSHCGLGERRNPETGVRIAVDLYAEYLLRLFLARRFDGSDRRRAPTAGGSGV